jgi:hypothetical protein
MATSFHDSATDDFHVPYAEEDISGATSNWTTILGCRR